jgi:uncharacterized protein involved in outer membrane biogenesis
MEEVGQTKKRKSWFKRILIGSGIFFVLLLAALIIIPIVYKDKILQLVVKEANKQLTSELKIEDFDLTILSTFPKLTMELKEVSITGQDDFEGIELVNLKSIEAKLDIWSVIGGDQVEIQSIKLVEPKINVRVLSDGRANYDILKADSLKTEEELSEPSSFKLSLNSYEIENGEISYIDRAGNLSATIVNLNHTGKGDLTAETVDFKTKTTSDAITVVMDGIPYLAGVKTDATVNLLMEFKENSSKFTLQENEIVLNAFKTSFDGFFELVEDYYNMDLTLDASKSTFKELISLIPSVFRTGYESMLTSGTFALNGFVKGKMTDTELPAWNFDLKVDNASFRYPDLPAGFEKITIRANTKREQGANLDNIRVDVDKFYTEFAGNIVDANLKLRTPISDPNISSRILAKVDLASLKKVMPMEEGESYNGKLDADITLDGKMSSIEQERYEEFDAKGWLVLKDMLYTSADLNKPVEVSQMSFKFSPRNLALEELDAKIGKSDFNMNGTVDNYMGYLFRDELLSGRFTFNSNNLDLDELMGISPSESTGANPETPTVASNEPAAVLVPSNIDFDLNTRIGKLTYDGMDIRNVQGNVNLKESVASLNNVQMNALGGSIGMNGSYDTKVAEKPHVKFAYDLKELDIKQLADNFITVEKLAPIAKYATGKISTSLSVQGDMNSNMDMNLESLTGNGDFFTRLVTVSGFEPMTKLANELRMPQLASQTLNDIRAKFAVKDGKLQVRPFNVKLGKINSEVQGWTSLTSDIDYKVKMNVPKDQIPAEMIKLVEQAIGKVNNVVPQLNLKGLPDIIPVNVNIGGTVTKPVIKSDFKESLLAASGNLKDQVKDLIDEKVKEVKDTVTKVIKEKVEDVKDDLIERKNKIMADAQKQADRVKAEAKKQADVIRAEANKQADDLVKSAANPIERKVREKSADEIRKQGEAKAKKVEDEAAKQADKIMADARAQADRLQ